MKNLAGVPFKEYMIHNRNPLSVKANGIMNISKMRADVDSNSNSTMPMEYNTGANIQSLIKNEGKTHFRKENGLLQVLDT
jgi:hypothetical protein